MISSEESIALEHEFGAHNYDPLPVVIARGKGVYVWDPEGNRYYDFLSAYSAVNQGHCNDQILKAMTDQAANLTLTSRAFYNSVLGDYEKYITGYFGFEKVLPMNSGAEGVETAIKICRKWAYEKKGVPDGKAKIIVCRNNFHGRTISLISLSNNPEAIRHFGPYTPGFESIPYNDPDALGHALEDENVAGFLVEPVQGEAGVLVPDESYIKRASELCRKSNALFIADEVQTGIGRTGSLLGVCGNCQCRGDCERGETYTKPDILILGKALSGGFYPVSAVLSDSHIMDVIKPGEHGSTFGGNPLASGIAIASLNVVRNEKLAQNARKLGSLFRNEMKKLIQKSSVIQTVRGKGLLNAIVINDNPENTITRNICMSLKDNGLLAKPTHGNIIRLSPPLIITEDEIMDCIRIIKETILAVENQFTNPD